MAAKTTHFFFINFYISHKNSNKNCALTNTLKTLVSITRNKIREKLSNVLEQLVYDIFLKEFSDEAQLGHP